MNLKKPSFYFILVFVLMLAACSSSSNANETGEAEEGEMSDELIIFNWSEYMPDKIIKDFEEEFGVDVTVSTFSSNQEMLAKVQSGTVPYDIVVPSDFYVQVMKEADLLEEINFDNIPNFENVSDEWKGLDFDPDNQYSITYMYGFDGIIYNKDKIDEPTSWEDLWNPEYKGHVVLMDANDELNVMMQQAMGNDINNPTQEQIEEGGEKLKELLPNVLMFTETPEAQLVNGEGWIAYGYSGEAAVAHQENDDIEFVLPEEGGVRWTDNMVIPKTANNKQTAEAFMDYLLRPEVSKLLSEEFPYGNPNEKAVELLDEEYRNLPGLDIPDDELEKAELSEVLDAERTQIVNRVIQEAKVKGEK